MKGNYNEIREGDALQQLKEIEDDSIDLLCTDPPYGYSFMNKDWDKAVVPVPVWKECLRVLKAGAFAFVMSAPRQDVLSRMIVNLQDAGFRTDFTSIYWTYASGFPKAANVSKLADKRYKEKTEYYELAKYLKESRESKNITVKELSQLFPSKTGGITGCVWNWENASNVPTEQQYTILKDKLGLDNRFDWLIQQETKRYEEAEREIIGKDGRTAKESIFNIGIQKEWNITKSATEQAKRLEGSYAGFQPKPALEVILVVMKPLNQKSFVDQALSNGKGITWLDSCRLNGRFPANLLVEDDSLNDGRIIKGGMRSVKPGHTKFSGRYNNGKIYKHQTLTSERIGYNDIGSYSRYFSLDSWYSRHEAQFIITPKASPAERNKGLDDLEKQKGGVCMRQYISETIFIRKNEPDKSEIAEYLKYWRQKKGLSQSEIDRLMGWNTMYSWMEGRKSGITLTSPEAWIKLKQILNFDDKFDKQMTELIEVKRGGFEPARPRENNHPTVKPLKLMSYLITMGSRENDIVLDPFCGSGTTLIAAHQLNRKWIGIELSKEYVEIARKRIEPYLVQQKLL